MQKTVKQVTDQTFSLHNSSSYPIDVKLIDFYNKKLITQTKDIQPSKIWKPSVSQNSIMNLIVSRDNQVVWDGIVPWANIIFKNEGVFHDSRLLPQQRVQPKPSYAWFLWATIGIVGLCIVAYLLFKGATFR